MTSSVDGLVSGLNTSSLISQLMTVEAAPQDRLKTKASTAQTAVTSYQSVNTKLAAFKSAAADLGDLATWRAIKPTSSSTSVTATATGGLTSSPGSLTFDVKQLASRQITTLKVATTTSEVDPDGDGETETVNDPITGNATITITPGEYAEDGTFTAGTPVDVDISADRSPAGIAAAINSAKLGIKAYVVQTSDTTGVLQFTGTKSGAENGFQISGLDGAGIGGTDPATTTLPQDAKIQVGDPDTTGYTVTSSSNTFTGLMSGVTLTVTKVEDGVTVDASADASAIAAKFKALVAAANATLSEISTQTAYDAETKKGSPLTGDFMVRQMSQTILSAISSGLTYTNPDYEGEGDLVNPPTLDGGSFSTYGIQLTRTGEITFDEDTFIAAYEADPDGIQQAGIGMADNFETLADSQKTSVTAVITNRKSEIDTINDQIDNWDVRLAAKRLALQKQYSDLETALGKLKNQSSWLSGQLAGLA